MDALTSFLFLQVKAINRKDINRKKNTEQQYYCSRSKEKNFIHMKCTLFYLRIASGRSNNDRKQVFMSNDDSKPGIRSPVFNDNGLFREECCLL